MTQLEANKKMVVEFYEKAINEKDFDTALLGVLGGELIHVQFPSDYR